MPTPKLLFETSLDTRLLAETLAAVPVGDVVRYVDLTDVLAGRDVSPGGSGYGALCSARRILMRENAIVFGAVRGVGLQRLADAQVVDTSAGNLAAIRRRATRAAAALGCVTDFASLDPERQARHNAALSVFAAVSACTAPAAVRKVESKVTNSGKPLPLAGTFKLFEG